MDTKRDHICVCICTYKRPKLLERLLITLQNQKTDGLFTYSIIVVDNDIKLSAKNTVTDINKKSLIPIEYYFEPEQNIALARNKAVQNAKGRFIAFIDDDEFPVENWLLNLYRTCNEYKADGVLGPVKPYFEKEPPEWIIKGKLCDRPTHETGTELHWNDTRTGNVLITKRIFDDDENLFNPEFGSQGEDKDFFRRMTKKGYVFVWCNEAPVYETVPADRWDKMYFLKRAFIQGSVSAKYYGSSMNIKLKVKLIIKSSLASILYTLIIPVVGVFGTHHFMKYLVKDIHHMSRLLAIFGVVKSTKRNI